MGEDETGGLVSEVRQEPYTVGRELSQFAFNCVLAAMVGMVFGSLALACTRLPP